MHAPVGPGGRDTAREYELEAGSIGGPLRQGQRPRQRGPGPVPALLAVLLALAAGAGSAHAERILRASVPDAALGARARDCRVYLPPSYDAPAARGRHYPVIVFLHGWPGAEGNWPGEGRAGETLDRLIIAGRIPEVIGLFPDGTGVGHLGRGMWMDSRDGRSRLETFLANDLLSWAGHHYRLQTSPAAHAVIGLSDGATGAMNLVMRHPSVYGAVGAHSGVYLLKADWSSAPLFGPEPGATALRERDSPLLQVLTDSSALARAVIYMDCGEGDDESLGDNRAFHARLDSLHIANEFHVYPGSHDWGFWRTHLEQSLVAVTARMRAGEATPAGLARP